MSRFKKIIHIFSFLFALFLLININSNPLPIANKVSFVNLKYFTTNKTSSLYKEIENKSSIYYEAPQDAVIDEDWKKVPGRNGIKVNIKESYKQMQKNAFYNENLLVFEQIPPKIKFQELGAAPVYSGHHEKKMVSLIIYVAGGTEQIPYLLHRLKENKVKATFFIQGKWANENKELVKMIAEQGHLIGNFAYENIDLSRLPLEEVSEQIERTNAIITSIIGKTPHLFAPPFSSYSKEMVEVSSELNMETILWTIHAKDLVNPTPTVMINHVMQNIHPGATILLHPTNASVQGISPLIQEIKNKDYKIGTIDLLLSESR